MVSGVWIGLGFRLGILFGASMGVGGLAWLRGLEAMLV